MHSFAIIPMFTLLIVHIIFPYYTFAVPISIQKGNSPVVSGNNSLFANNAVLISIPDQGCRYKAQSYSKGDEVPTTEEPCLRCQCKKRAVVCKLRICTEQMPNAPPPGCVVVQKAKSCCPKLVCSETKKITREREQRLSTGPRKNETIQEMLPQPGEGYCVHDGTVYAEGSAMKSDSPCDYCFCIRGEMKCSRPQCVMPLNGCKPRYRSFACCPTNYDCSESNTTAILQTSISTSTAIPQFLKGCQVLGRFIYEGEPVLPIDLDPDYMNICQSCFCLGGTVRCRPLECSRPIEGCRPVTEEGHCCPTRYECETSSFYPDFLNESQVNLSSGENSISGKDERKKFSGKGEPLNGTIKASSSPEVFLLNVNYPNATKGNESEIHFNKLKSDIGSREERRNKDKDDYTSYKTSYEDDERDYLFGIPSLESMDHELISKITFDGTTDVPATATTAKSESLPTPLKSTETKDGSNSISPLDFDESRKNKTTEQPYTTTTPSESLMESQLNVTQQAPLPLVETPNESNRTISGSNTSFTENPMLAPSTNSLLDQSPEPTMSNLEFIHFGEEDALHLLPTTASSNSSENHPLNYKVPMKITYDKELIKSSLIPPTPQNGYILATLAGGGSRSGGVSDNGAIKVVSSPKELTKDSLRNVIMDVPVSTSLYNSGYYQNGNGILTNANSSYPGKVYDDSGSDEDHPLIIKEAEMPQEIPPIPVLHAKDTRERDSLLVSSTLTSNPSRTYSKFSVDDSPSYRLQNNNNSNNSDGEVIHNPGYTKTKHSPTFHNLDPIIYEDEDEDGILDSFEQEDFGGLSNEFQKPTHTSGSGVSKNKTVVKPIRITSNPASIPSSSDPSHKIGTFRPVVAFPFTIAQKPKDSLISLGLKLSGCNIYGKMYKIGNVIRELSGSCVQCHCTEMGVHCSEVPC